MNKITVSMLRGACKEQRELFRKTFPDGAPVTVASARKACKAGLDVRWLVNHLPKPLFEQYEAARDRLFEQYEAARKPLYDQYVASRKPLDDQYMASLKPLYDQYVASRKPLDDQYVASLKPLDEPYWAAIDKLLVRMLRRMK